MKKILAIIVAAAMLCPLFSFAAPAANDSETATVMNALDIMKGDPDGGLRLDDLVTRAEFTKVAVAASEWKNSVASNIAVSPYKDVSYLHWAAPYIRTAVSNSICKGYPDGTFKPDGTVLYEESVTMFLRLLGYTDNDFGSSWPYGQVGIAEKIGLVDDLAKNIGDTMTRRDVMRLTYNLLDTKTKAGSDYILKLGYKIVDDAVLIATAKEDSSVGGDKVYTSAGLYKIDSGFNFDNVGKKGSLIIKNSDELIGFIPNEQSVTKYSIYQVLDGEIIVMRDGALSKLDADKSLAVYNKSQKTTLSAMLPLISPGDVLTTYTTQNGVLDYGTVKTDELKGPLTVSSGGWISQIGLVSPTIIRNGVKASASDIAVNDVIYYSDALNTVWSYSKTVTGVYEKALPNKDMPTSIVVSGVTYQLEGVGAVSKLSSGGQFNYGDVVTLLLGRNKQVADVVAAKADGQVYGYVMNTGIKSFTDSDNNTYSSFFIKLAQGDGSVYDYTCDKDYESLKNAVVKLDFTQGKARASQIYNEGYAGFFDWQSKKLGDAPLSTDLQIIDVTTSDREKSGSFASVFPQRLQNTQLTDDKILFAEKNDKGELCTIFLSDVTGDAYTYGLMIEAQNIRTDYFIKGIYVYDIGGKRGGLVTDDVLYSVTAGNPALFWYNASGGTQLIQDLTRVDAWFESLSSSTITMGGTVYPLSDKAAVYRKNSTSDYTLMPLSDLLSSTASYTITAYYDKPIKSGGRIRVLIAEDKK